MKFQEKQLKNILVMYGINSKFDYSLLRGGIENLHYLIKTKSQKLVLRIYKKRKINSIKSEIELIEYLHKNGFPVPKILATKKNQKLIEYKNYFVVVFPFVKGKPLEWRPVNKNLAKNIGEGIAKMHKLLMKFKPKSKNSKDKNSLKDSSISNVNYKLLNKQKEILKNDLRKIRIRKLRQIIVHGDINRENLLIRDNNISAILDFEDSHTDYLVWDFAVAITQIFITKTYGIDWEGMKYFIKGYTSIIPLSKEEKDVFILFLKLRNLKLIIDMTQREEKTKEVKSIKISAIKKINLIEKNEELLKKILM